MPRPPANGSSNNAAMVKQWNRLATRLLKMELERHEVGYKELSRRLEQLGIQLESAQLSNKINRGTFSFAFYLQCMRALDVEVVRLFDRELEEKKVRRGP